MPVSSPQGAPEDRYVVQEYLSEGGMGAIYIGRKLGAGGFSKSVVLKQLLPEFTSQREFRDLFLREARLSATLDHANIVHTIDLVNAGEDFFIVMEYVPGADLRTLMKKAKRRRRRISPAASLCITRELLSALGYAHAKRGRDGKRLNLIHRDVSPSNILISQNGEVKLTDFGIAKASTHTSVTYRVKGKIGYMSPEQAKSEPMDHRSDLFSLAVCLYEMVSGERLFVKTGLNTSDEELYARPIPHLSRDFDDVPPEFDQLMFRALHVDPDRRYQTAGAFNDALLRCAHRARLMMSAPELAAHLVDLCGPPDSWREPDEPERPSMEMERPGTEVYESEDDDAAETGSSDVDMQSPRWGASSIDYGDHAPERRSSRHSIMDLDRLRGMELTSMIDISRQAAGGGPERRPSGSRPLVDLEGFGVNREPWSGANPPSAHTEDANDDRGIDTLDGPPIDPNADVSALEPLENQLEPEPGGPAAHHPARGAAAASGPAMSQAAGPPAGQGAGQAGSRWPATAGQPPHPGYPSTSGYPRVHRGGRSRAGVWVLIIVLLLAIGVVAAIGLSGPDMQGEQGGAEPPTSPGVLDEKPDSPGKPGESP